MKKSLNLILAVCMLMIACMCPVVYADDLPALLDSGHGIDIALEGGKSIDLVGTVQPTIISVTMPAYIPFDMNYNLSTQNKVISPTIDVTNHSTVAVDISVGRTSVNLTGMRNARWSDSGTVVGDNQIAVGFMESDSMPSTLPDTVKWLRNGVNNTPLLTNLATNDVGRLFVVGNIGKDAGSEGTFTVTPTLLVEVAKT